MSMCKYRILPYIRERVWSVNDACTEIVCIVFAAFACVYDIKPHTHNAEHVWMDLYLIR